MAYPTVVSGTVITSAWGNGVRDQLVTRLADASTRTSTITAPTDAMYCDLTDRDVLTRYNGSSWELVSTPVQFARLTSDATSITTNTTLANITGLSLPVFANSVYEMDGDILYTAAGGSGAGQIKIGWTGPASATLTWTNIGLVVNGASGVSGSTTFDVSAIGDARSYGAAGTGTSVHVKVHGILVTAGSAGTFQFQAAQAASSATATTVKAGSHFRLSLVA